MIRRLEIVYEQDPFKPMGPAPMITFKLRVLHDEGTEQMSECFPVYGSANGLEDLFGWMFAKAERDFRRAWKEYVDEHDSRDVDGTDRDPIPD